MSRKLVRQELGGHSVTEPCRAAERRKPGQEDSIDWKAVQQAHPDQVGGTALSMLTFTFTKNFQGIQHASSAGCPEQH